MDTRGTHIIQRGNRRIVIHDEPPPKKRRKHHALLYIGIDMSLIVLSWIGLQIIGVWRTNYQLNSTYEYPRIYQASVVVGHDDSADYPTTFIFENLGPGADYRVSRRRLHPRLYLQRPTLFSDHADQISVTAELKDVNGDGKVDISLHIQDQRIVFLNDGKQFKEQ